MELHELQFGNVDTIKQWVELDTLRKAEDREGRKTVA